MDYKIIMTDGTEKELKDTKINAQAMEKIILEANETGWLKFDKLYIAANRVVSIEEI